VTLVTKHGGDMLEKRTAVFSECERYRYLLRIVWDPSAPLMANISLNPSTADEMHDDPTLRRIKEFARKFGHGGLLMTNLFAFRATDPKDMKAEKNPVGQADWNDVHIREAAVEAKTIVCAWGMHGEFLGRGAEVRSMLARAGHALKCFKLCSNGQPYHPLYLPASSDLIDF